MSSLYYSQDTACDCWSLTDGLTGPCLLYSGDLFVSENIMSIPQWTRSQSLCESTECIKGFLKKGSVLQNWTVWKFSIHLALFFGQIIYILPKMNFINHRFTNKNDKIPWQTPLLCCFIWHLIFVSHLKKHAINRNPPRTITQFSLADKEWLIFK